MENVDEIDLIITVVFGTLVMFMMVVVIVLAVVKYQKRVLKQQEELRETEKNYQQSLLEATVTATEKEREEVSKNIHDEVGTALNVIKLNQSRIRKNIDDKEVIEKIITTNNELLNEIIEHVRAISANLMSPTLIKFGFYEALNMLCRQINESKEVSITLNYSGTLKRLDSTTEVHLFRTCKEVLNNILKHSGATVIKISLLFEENALSISILYNARGINDQDVGKLIENNKGLGLKSIFGRVQILKGTINYYSKSNNEAEIFIKLPLYA